MRAAPVLLAGLTVALVGVAAVFAPPADPADTRPTAPNGSQTPTPPDAGPPATGDAALERVAGPEAFAAFVAAGESAGGDLGALGPIGRRDVVLTTDDPAAVGTPTVAETATPVGTAVADTATDDAAVTNDAAAERAATSGGDGDGGADVRVATTNVRERGVDEPSLVTTVGRHLYYAPPSPPERRPVLDREGDDGRRGDEAPPSERGDGPKTHVIDTTGPANPSVAARVNGSGRLLRTGDALVALREGRLVGYDVAAPDDPDRRWSRSLNGTVVGARATNGTVYAVLRRPVAAEPEACTYAPTDGVTVDCGEIRRPAEPVPDDATYTVLSVDAADGGVDGTVAVLGSRDDAAVYLSGDSIYLTHTRSAGRGAVLAEALLAAEVVPGDVRERLREIRSYDLSPRTERTEIRLTVGEWLDGLDGDRRHRVRRTLREQVTTHVEDRQRNLTTTGIVRLEIGDGVSVAATGTVPGRPLDSFALDRGDDTLRIATTVPRVGDVRSENDLYTLSADSLERIGSERGMGAGQEIRSVRYVGETAYLVTFRRVDPFHVVDLSDPADPVERGVLRLPGFSSYLHPVGDDRVLGIGREDGRAKAVLFDASEPTDPEIADSTVLDRRWDDVADSHHAFLVDRRHEAAFLPAGGDGVVLGYGNDSLTVERTVRTDGAVRARYVGDYLYVFGREAVVVVDERDWSRVDTLELDT